ncbi:CoA pyrophosphatase [Aliidiomarina minuta]|uniref:CoA pyrophosphatase n=1 Tax=Aliidiomarina minuta TaxID=880057 RepID=A0A432W810_9GAMM|nr:CoA pyrophosphatase [Aliidiomarina minuta]RUO26096.1 CoA pyrophosphatase [Aliidiomarina minuta]
MIKTRAQFLHQFHLFRSSPARPLKMKGLRPAAVLIPLIEGERSIEVVLTKRTQHLRHHAGQICFPGGRQEPADADLKATALREYEEELGVSAEGIDIVGQLPDYPVISQFIIRPYVGFLSRKPEWNPDPGEVADIFTVPLHHLLSQEQHYAYKVERFIYDKIWFIPWQERVIWGATAGIIRNLAEQLDPKQTQLYRPLN